jgi:alpha-beta hydrolase superfamily lysophospholipase
LLSLAQRRYPSTLQYVAVWHARQVWTQSETSAALGSHLVIAGAKHEILQEQGRYRSQFWAAFDAFVPGTPLFG